MVQPCRAAAIVSWQDATELLDQGEAHQALAGQFKQCYTPAQSQKIQQALQLTMTILDGAQADCGAACLTSLGLLAC